MDGPILKALDLMGFAGSMSAGVDQAGFDVIAKREPSEFKAFGVRSHTLNMPWMETQVADPEQWELPSEQVELVYGCPPCSGFSQLSHANTIIHGATYGAAAEINKCMGWFVDFTARVKPQIAIMESVGAAFKGDGRPWMESLFQKLLDQSGLPYKLYHVNHDSRWIGGDVNRPRYFLVASLVPFGIGREFVTARTVDELIGDLPFEDLTDTDWGHIHRSKGSRNDKTMQWLRSMGRNWEPGTRLPDNVKGLEPPEWELKPEGSKRSTRLPEDAPNVYSDWFSTDPFSAARWRGDRPFGVVVGASADRAIHPSYDRSFSFRELARFMSLPDDWSMRAIVEEQRTAELGKAVTSAAGKWIAHWARMAMLGTPGDYAGVQDTDNPDIRVINAQSKNHIEALANPPAGSLWTPPTADPDPATWIIDRRSRPDEWWQREDVLGLFAEQPKTRRTAVRQEAVKVEPKKVAVISTPRAAAPITRVPPENVVALLAQAGIDKAEAAKRLGVSGSRINELTGHTRPGSWLNVARWNEVKEAILGA